jgi:transcriptional regulator with XRE-family HTH domain
MGRDESTINRKASLAAAAFGDLIRSRRKALKMRQDQLALATGVGRRFLIELEAGKSSCQLGRSLLVARALGLSLPELVSALPISGAARDGDELELPEFTEEVEGPDGQPADLF